MDKKQVFDKIAAILSDRFNIDKSKITENTNFINDLDADSIDMVEFEMELEDDFGADIPDDDAAKIQTVGEAVDYIMAHQSK